MNIRPFKFKTPTTIALFAPPYSGKSTLTRKILKNADVLFDNPPKLVVYCYNQWLPMLEDMKDDFTDGFFIPHEGVPTKESIENWMELTKGVNSNEASKHFIIVLDDLQQQCQKEKSSAEMFTVGSHHSNYTIIYLCHNIFGRGQYSRTISINSHYFILFRNNRDTQQVRILARQIMNRNSEYFIDAYNKAVALPWGYLVVDIHPTTTDKDYKLLTGIIPGERTIIYTPRRQ